MKYLLMFIVLFALGTGYLFWLDYGCEVSGVMTWQGKVCVENLVPEDNPLRQDIPLQEFPCTVENCKG